MKKLLNTLYVTTPEAYISKDGNNIIVSNAGKEIFRIPVSNIESINTFGYQGASPGAMRLCADNGVALSFFSPNGRFVARIQGPVHGNVFLRCRQYDISHDKDISLRLARLFIFGKIYNSRNVLRRYVRDYADRPGVEDVTSAADKLKRRCLLASSAHDMDSLRGIEGDSAAIYFSVFQNLILNETTHFKFDSRQRRPPCDMVNAMLSFGYTLLANECASALEGVGLDPAVGFMHTIRPGRNSLALDLMEELRSYIVDRLVLSVINNRQIGINDFRLHTNSSEASSVPVLFTDSGIKKFLSAWQAKKQSEITHPFLQEKIKLGLLPHVQAQLLARYLRNDMNDYPVFIAK